MNARITARDWLRERRRLRAAVEPDAADAGSARAAPAGRAAKRRERRPLGERLPKRRGLTVLALSQALRGAEPEAARSPWLIDPEITETRIGLQRLPPVFEGLKIVHLTDIHHSLFTSLEEVDRAVHLANRMEPDLVALTGDYVTFSPNFIAPVARALGKLRARLGVFAVLGNHDFQVDAEAVTRALRSHRIRVLRNSRHPIRAGGKTLWILGVDDLWWQKDDLPGALHSVPPRDAKVLLCHNPLGIWEAATYKIDLVLSGHTHGGQVRLPGFGSLYRSKLGERFVEGWNRLRGTQIYVSRGIGKVVVPIRVACPAEIACLTLHRVPAEKRPH